jgi:hypothetical protein
MITKYLWEQAYNRVELLLSDGSKAYFYETESVFRLDGWADKFRLYAKTIHECEAFLDSFFLQN